MARGEEAGCGLTRLGLEDPVHPLGRRLGGGAQQTGVGGTFWSRWMTRPE